MTAKPAFCPHCRAQMPRGFIVCRPCWRELPFPLRAEMWTAQGQAHFPEIYKSGADRLEMATRALLSHLRQFSSAIA